MKRPCSATGVLALLLLCACSGADRTAHADRSAPVSNPPGSRDGDEAGPLAGGQTPATAAGDAAVPVAAVKPAAPAAAGANDTPAAQDQQAPSTDDGVRRALARPISLDLSQAPLREALDILEKRSGVRVEVDWDALQYTGVGTSTMVSLRAPGVSARSALEMLLCPLDLGWTVENEGVLITTPEEIANALYTRVYDVADFNARDALIEIITRTVAFTSWDEVGGPGAIAPFRAAGIDALVVSQTEDAHEQIAELLFALREVRNPPDERPDTDEEPETTAASRVARERRAEARIRKALDRGIDLEFNKEPLFKVVERLSRALDIPVVIDGLAFEDVGLGTDTPVTLSTHDKTIRSALEDVLESLDLTWDIRFEALWITTPEQQESALWVKVYDVSGLPSFRDDAGKGVPDYAQLNWAITACIEPRIWDEMGGPGSIQAFESRGIHALVISQTRDVHQQVAELLAKLRRIRDNRGEKPNVDKLPPLPPAARFRSPYGFGPQTGLFFPAAAPAPLPPLPANAAREAAVVANNRFALDLYGEMRDRPGNLVFSPASVSAALAMVYAGACGETAHEMARTLRFPIPRESVPQGYAALLAALAEAQGRGYELTLANRLWGQQGYAFRESYVGGLQESFGAQLDRVDFQNPTEAARKINGWVADQTRGRIREIVSPGAFDELTRFVVTNAVYFKAPWAIPFPESDTRPAPFNGPNAPVPVHMMHQLAASRYTAVDKMEVLELPYAGMAASMVIVLPEGDLASVEATLSAEKLDQWMSQLRPEMVDVTIPRFKLDSARALAGTLESMGMARVFDAERSDLSGVSEGEPLWLNDVLHKALVEVDEKGTEAAAATAVGGLGMAGPRTAAPVFRADRPFLFLIRDLRTGTILFLGRLVEPETIPQ